jgi:hypothetical protein
MKKQILWAAALVIAFAMGAQAQEKEKEATHQYIGVKKCSMCHKSEAKGNQFGKWSESAHAKAFEVLASEKALAVAKEKGLAKPPQESPECLKCHVTGAGKPAEAFAATFVKEDGVGCESCHGPGSDYMSMKVMKDPAAAKAAGLWMPDAKTCTGCHNEESPTFKGFDYEKYLAKVAHPNPKKASE